MKETIEKLINSIILPKYNIFPEGELKYRIYNVSGFGDDSNGYLVRYFFPVSDLDEKGIKKEIADDTVLLLKMIGLTDVKNHRNNMTYNDSRLIDIIGGDKRKK